MHTRRAERTPDSARLSPRQKTIGIGLLLFYLFMIALTIATAPYLVNVSTPGMYERTGGVY